MMLRTKVKQHQIILEATTMKKVLSIIVSSLVAVSFAGMVFAAEPAKTETPASPAAGEVKKEEAKPIKKHVKKHRRHHKHHKAAKKAAVPAETPATTPATPAAK